MCYARSPDWRSLVAVELGTSTGIVRSGGSRGDVIESRRARLFGESGDEPSASRFVDEVETPSLLLADALTWSVNAVGSGTRGTAWELLDRLAGHPGR